MTEKLNSLLVALDEATIVRKIQIPHDEARNRYHVEANTVKDFDEFTWTIGDYYNHHFSACMSRGGRLSQAEAASRAKQILVREYRRRNGDIVAAFTDAHEGLNTGLRGILDKIAEALKAEAVENYVRDAFDKHVAPNAWERKVEIIRQLLEQIGPTLPASFRPGPPERYAANYEELIRAHVGWHAADFHRFPTPVGGVTPCPANWIACLIPSRPTTRWTPWRPALTPP